MRKLIQEPAVQASRLLDELDRVGSLELADDKGRVQTVLKRAAFSQTMALAVTLDDLTHLAARAHHLSAGGVKLPSRPTWVLSVDDLRIHADILRYPYQFLHFMRERLRAAAARRLELTDEQQHLGLYLHKKHYATVADTYDPSMRVSFNAFDAEIDEYFQQRGTQSVSAKVPGPTLPPLVVELLERLQSGRVAGHCDLGLWLHDCSASDLTRLADLITESRNRSMAGGIPAPLWMPGNPGMTIVCGTVGGTQLGAASAREFALAGILLDQCRPRYLLELEYDAAGRLLTLAWKWYEESSILPIERGHIEALARHLAGKRVRKAANKAGSTPIERNDPCPCGSTRKFKKCHGRSS